MSRPITNIGASVRARLLNISRSRGQDFQFTVQRYVAERFVYRLGVSPYRERFILKGAMLFVLWDEAIHRPTRDLDLAGYWADDADSLAAVFREICSIPDAGDGLAFAADALEITPIRDGAEYHGFRIRMKVHLAGAVIPFQVDVGFGDAVVPEATDVEYPVLLDGATPRVRAYPKEAVLAEKLHAVTSLAEANSRFKDFFDVWLLSSRFPFAGERITAAIAATFERRRSATLSPWPVALSSPFYADPTRGKHWTRYLTRSTLTEAPSDFPTIGRRVLAFFETPIRALSTGGSLTARWAPGGPWA